MSARPFDELVKDFSEERLAGIEALSDELPGAMTLRELREAMPYTQQEVADGMGVNQSAVSKMEDRDDARLSGLRRYIEAMGGLLTVTASFPAGDVVIADHMNYAMREAARLLRDLDWRPTTEFNGPGYAADGPEGRYFTNRFGRYLVLRRHDGALERPLCNDPYEQMRLLEAAGFSAHFAGRFNQYAGRFAEFAVRTLLEDRGVRFQVKAKDTEPGVDLRVDAQWVVSVEDLTETGGDEADYPVRVAGGSVYHAINSYHLRGRLDTERAGRRMLTVLEGAAERYRNTGRAQVAALVVDHHCYCDDRAMRALLNGVAGDANVSPDTGEVKLRARAVAGFWGTYDEERGERTPVERNSHVQGVLLVRDAGKSVQYYPRPGARVPAWLSRWTTPENTEALLGENWLDDFPDAQLETGG